MVLSVVARKGSYLSGLSFPEGIFALFLWRSIQLGEVCGEAKGVEIFLFGKLGFILKVLFTRV